MVHFSHSVCSVRRGLLVQFGKLIFLSTRLLYLERKYMVPKEPPKTPPLRGGWTRQQSAKWRHYNRKETSETTITSFTSPLLTHFISPFSPWWRPKPVQSHPLFYPSWTSLSNPSSASSSSVALFPLPVECPLQHGGGSGSRGRQSGIPHWRLSSCIYIYPPGVVLPPKLRSSGGLWRPDGVRRL